MRRRRDPQFTLVTAVYLAEPYLPAYLDSIARLDGGLGDVEFIFVDDGSPDGSPALISSWIDRTAAPARVVSKPNGGLASARNVGLDLARGAWVSFPDPDDALHPHYLAALRDFLHSREGASPPALLAAKVEQFSDDPAQAIDNHPLGYRYHTGRRVVRLTQEPRWFHTHAPSGFYRRELVERFGLRFDHRLNAGFEDAAFAADYLLRLEDPTVGVVPDAVYRYRRRTNSVTATMWSKPDKYTVVPEHGYLRLLESCDPPPAWLQLLVLYDLVWFFHEYDQPGSPNRSLAPETAATFLTLLDRVLARIDEPLLYGYPLHPLPFRVRAALAARKTHRMTAREAVVRETDDGSGSVLTYLVAPSDPGEDPVLVVDGRQAEPLEHRSCPVEYYGEVFATEHTVRVGSFTSLVLCVDGRALSLTGPDGSAARFHWETGA
ncbi:MAG: glycosyltransferase family 2 protein [Acidimicrobiia bacterium]